ncbi:PQQ-binding-like beta-propeller repeat protein [Clostridium sp.]|uniref:outer membrane protein assembly factor BamB family protein n=1 Tax=Clostridium sp. TaxID=1506 RepID=UPI00321782DE
MQGSKGASTLKKINGLTGEAVWSKKMQCESLIGNDPVNGGLLATNIVGKNKLSDRVIFSLARYKGFNRGAVIAMDKKSGRIIWETDLDNYMWSSPVDFYDEEGNGDIIQCDSVGNMFLMDGETGRILDKVNLGSNIESSPAIFNDMVVVATRGGLMCGVKIK